MTDRRPSPDSGFRVKPGNQEVRHWIGDEEWAILLQRQEPTISRSASRCGVTFAICKPAVGPNRTDLSHSYVSGFWGPDVRWFRFPNAGPDSAWQGKPDHLTELVNVAYNKARQMLEDQ